MRCYERQPRSRSAPLRLRTDRHRRCERGRDLIARSDVGPWPSFCAQGHHRVDPCRPASGDVTGNDRHEPELCSLFRRQAQSSRYLPEDSTPPTRLPGHRRVPNSSTTRARGASSRSASPHIRRLRSDVPSPCRERSASVRRRRDGVTTSRRAAGSSGWSPWGRENQGLLQHRRCRWFSTGFKSSASGCPWKDRRPKRKHRVVEWRRQGRP
jgi:hypothetical protein